MAPFFFWKPRRVRRYRRRTIITERKAKLHLEDGQTFEVQGELINVKVIDNASRSGSRIRNGVLTIKLASTLSENEKKRFIPYLGRRALTREFLPIIDKRVRELNTLHFNSEINKVRLKDTSTLWGSCSIRNNINLDFRLLFAPQNIIDAIIIHELAHTVRRDHSKAFWSLVTNIIPDYKQRRKWLKENANALKPAQVQQEQQEQPITAEAQQAEVPI